MGTSRRFKRALPVAGISLERGTENVPDDGRFHLIVNREIVKCYKSEKVAVADYQALREAYLLQNPVAQEHEKVQLSDIIREDYSRLSNKELIWSPEDFERVGRKTKRHPRA